MMRKVLLYLLVTISVVASSWFAVTLYQMLFCYTYDNWNAYPMVSLFLLVGSSFLVYAVLSVICLFAATMKGGLEK